MNERRITYIISVYACLILANTSENKFIKISWVILTIFWLIKYVKASR